MSKATLLLQKEILKNLLIVTVTALFIGSLPLTVVVFYVYNNKLPFARTIASCALLFTANFGTIYVFLILTLFKSYRKAVVAVARSVCQAVKKVLGMFHPPKITPSNALFRVSH
uniref:G_PROTEIN_RECEP_F1_2 domain-containing protein n=1 Tax=Steinernema glaseri TaxID=37863 RepID=A0A1I7YPA8_9BILA